MGITQIEASRYECDGCGKTKVVTDDSLPNGYHGEITVVGHGGAQTVKIYACTSRCISKAINARGSFDVKPKGIGHPPIAPDRPIDPDRQLPQPGASVGVRNPDGSPAAPLES